MFAKGGPGLGDGEGDGVVIGLGGKGDGGSGDAAGFAETNASNSACAINSRTSSTHAVARAAELLRRRAQRIIKVLR
jgi:hypothetical protein